MDCCDGVLCLVGGRVSRCCWDVVEGLVLGVAAGAVGGGLTVDVGWVTDVVSGPGRVVCDDGLSAVACARRLACGLVGSDVP